MIYYYYYYYYYMTMSIKGPRSIGTAVYMGFSMHVSPWALILKLDIDN